VSFAISFHKQTFYKRINRTPPPPEAALSASYTAGDTSKAGSNSQPPRPASLPHDASRGQPHSHSQTTSSTVHSAAVVPAENEDSSDDEEEDSAARGAENRQYIKELLTAHPIWKDGTYWEQTLWQCAIEQVRAQTS
jgi:hypothetical protein